MLKLLPQRTLNKMMSTSVSKVGRSAIVISANTTLRLYSSSSSSSSSSSPSSPSSTKKNNTTPATPQKQELPFVRVNPIHPRDLAQSTFFAGHRPLPIGNDQVRQSKQQPWEEEDCEEENSGSNVGVKSLANPLSPYLTSSLFHPTQSTVSMSPAESKFIVYRFLSGIELKLKKEQLKEESLNKKKKTTEESEVDNVKKQGQLVNSKEKTLYFTNIIQKRKLKMKKHKLRKLRKRTRALRKRLGKI